MTRQHVCTRRTQTHSIEDRKRGNVELDLPRFKPWRCKCNPPQLRVTRQPSDGGANTCLHEHIDFLVLHVRCNYPPGVRGLQGSLLLHTVATVTVAGQSLKPGRASRAAVSPHQHVCTKSNFTVYDCTANPVLIVLQQCLLVCWLLTAMPGLLAGLQGLVLVITSVCSESLDYCGSLS